MSETKLITAADIDRRLRAWTSRSAPAPAPEPPSPTRLRYRAAVAPLGWFDVGALEASQGSLDEAEVRALLLADCDRVFTPHGTRWRLLPAVRDETIRRLGSPAAVLATLSGTPADPADVTRTMTELYLRHGAPGLERQTVEQLHGTRNAAELLAPLGLPLPTDGQIRDCLGLAELLDPLRGLVQPVFIGREAELDTLAAYVDPLRRPQPGQRRRLAIHGPGGVGKSALVARFILDQLDRPSGRTPLAYLSFDRADLVPDRPLTLLVEATQQLGVLHPDVAAEGEVLAGAVRATLRRPSTGDQGETDERKHLARFAGFVNRLSGQAGAPLVWVLDTMEQVQRRGPLSVGRLWAFLDRLQSVCPRLRVVFAGRAPLVGHPVQSLPLAGLDERQALAFLRHLVPTDRIGDRLLRIVVERVSTIPLSLKLAAELLRREGERGIPAEPVLLALVSAEEVQGLLYRRILDRLDNPELRRIANPGLVVRRITPRVIQRVLAAPCGLGHLSYLRAVELFQALRQEASLVEPVPGEEAVIHRADVRRAMLRLLQRDDPEAVTMIHRYAADYYADRPGPQARAEQLYHLLALGEGERTLDRLWDPLAEPLLEGSLDELPAASRAYLANRLGIPVDADTRMEADSEVWADQAIRVGRELITAGQPATALMVVGERDTDRLDVIRVAVEALASAGRLTDATDQVANTLQRSGADGPPGELVDLLTLGARIAEDAGRYELAVRWSRQARMVAERAQLTVASITAGVAEARTLRRSGAAGSAAASAIRAWLVETIEGLERLERYRHPNLVRDLAAEVGRQAPTLVVEAARLHGVNIEGAAGTVLTDTFGEDRVRNTVTNTLPSGAAEVRQWRANTTSTEAGIGISSYLDAEPDEVAAWVGPLSDAFKAEVDQPIYRNRGAP